MLISDFLTHNNEFYIMSSTVLFGGFLKTFSIIDGSIPTDEAFSVSLSAIISKSYM